LVALRVGKKTQKRQKRTEKTLKALKKEKKSKKVENYQFNALNLIYDPQDFSEKLYKEVESTNESFEIKIMMLELIARLIGIHQLYLLNYYAFLIRFINPHQREVAKMLWFAAIASHELVPPEVSFFFFYESILNIFNLKNIEQMLKTIANNFITERNTSEVIAIGINAIREICARCPLAMSEDLLGDLVQYKDYKDKAVTTSAKSLIQLFRVKNPKLLNRRDRVKTIFKINFINY
jgi:protein SDA1